MPTPWSTAAWGLDDTGPAGPAERSWKHRALEAEARAALLQAQIVQHQQSVMSDALEVEQRLNEARVSLTLTPTPTPTPTSTPTPTPTLTSTLTPTPTLTLTLTRRS